MIKDNYRKYIVLACIVIALSLVGYKIFSKQKTQTEDKKLSFLNETIKEEEPLATEYSYVDIKGAVTNPGVYKMISDERVVDVIVKAGGLLKQADTSVINLSKKVVDEMNIIIYTKEEMEAFKNLGNTVTEVIKYIEKECSCPDESINDACINNKEEIISEKVSINNGTKEELMTLTGIGEAKADAIIAYRTENGLFNNIDEVKNVSGIGDSIFDTIKNDIII